MKNKLLILFSLATLFISGCKKESFTQSGIAEDHFFLKGGSQKMPITVGGNVDSKKFLVIIHGGPGGNAIIYRDEYVKSVVEKEFAVVYWDQRFAGNTQGNGGNSDISAYRQDIKNLLLLLKAKYGSENEFYLFAHSWGGFLAPYFLVDGDNQNMVKGWIQIGGAHNYRMNDSLTREMLLYYGDIEIKAGRNIEKWEEIVEWCKANGFEGRRNTFKLNSFAHQAENLMWLLYLPIDIEYDSRQEAMFSNLSNIAISYLRKVDIPTHKTPNSDNLHKIKLPTLLLWGKYDFVCPPGLADDIISNIGSTDVSYLLYPNSGHSPMINEVKLFWNDVIKWVKEH